MSKPKNVTFTLPPELVEKYRYYVNKEYFPSMNAGVREALEEYAKKIDKEMLKKEMVKASRDPLFMGDVKESMNAFESVDEQIAEENSEW